VPGRPLKEFLPNASEEALELIAGFLQYDPKSRLSAYQALHGSWFKDLPEVEELKHLTDVVQQSPDKRRSMFSGLLKKENRKRGFSVSIPGVNNTEKHSLAAMILKSEIIPSMTLHNGNSTIPDPAAPQEQHREQQQHSNQGLQTPKQRLQTPNQRLQTPKQQLQLQLPQSQLQPSPSLVSGFDLPIISPISPFWKDA
ncbi:hypothetical protein BGZ65_009238, partial [Modicella reniformis]